MLTKEILLSYHNQGWAGPFSLLNPNEVGKLTSLYLENRSKFVSGREINALEESEKFAKKPWFKSVHAVIPAFYDLVTHPSIVEKVNSILGKNVLLWGTSVTIRQPGQSHRWHIDVEHKRCKGVSVFIGLQGTSRKATLKVVTGSHKINNTNFIFSTAADDNMVVMACRKHFNSAEIVTIDMKEGEFFLFDGLLWHGSENASDQTRYAVIAQYTTPDCKVEVPLNWDEPIRWAKCSPPCVLVSGSDTFHINTLISKPA
jgi:ectoine hydroxylase-related dioxygenase (phytanoyl-CoA dioxygenase family)